MLETHHVLEVANQFASLIPVDIVILSGTVVEAVMGNHIEQTDCTASDSWKDPDELTIRFGILFTALERWFVLQRKLERCKTKNVRKECGKICKANRSVMEECSSTVLFIFKLAYINSPIFTSC